MKDSTLFPAWSDLDPIRIYHDARLDDVYDFSLMHAGDPRLMSLVRYRSRLLHIPVLDVVTIQYLMTDTESHYRDVLGCDLFTAEQAQHLHELGNGQDFKLLPAKIGDGSSTYTIGGLPPRSWRAVHKLLSNVLTQDERGQLISAVHSGVINIKVGTGPMEIHKLSHPLRPLRRSLASIVPMGCSLTRAEESGQYLLQVVLPDVISEDIAITLEMRTLLHHRRTRQGT